MTKKRGHGEGTIRQLGSGRWSWARMVGRDAEGKVIYERVTADTQKELLKAVEAHKKQKSEEKKQHVVPDFQTFSEGWFCRYRGNLRVSTQSSYRYTLKKLQGYWEDVLVDQIHTSDIYDMLEHFKRTGLSASYVKKMRSMMYQIMDAAEADELINRNPVRFTTFRVIENTSLKDAFTPMEVKSLITAEHSKARDFAILSCFTGLRTQEILALCGSDIAKGGVNITVRRAVNMDGNIPIIGLTKSRDSNRVVPVPVCVQDIAVRYREYGERLIWQSPQKADRPINPSTYRAAFKRLCGEVGIRCLTPHCCRHTYITQLHAHGVDMSTIKVLAGHSRRDVTEGYTHISWEILSAAANKLNDLFELGLSA